jgi:hypothetical protein
MISSVEFAFAAFILPVSEDPDWLLFGYDCSVPPSLCKILSGFYPAAFRRLLLAFNCNVLLHFNFARNYISLGLLFSLQPRLSSDF